MTLTEQWKKGGLEALDELIKQIEVIDNNRALSDEYLESKGLCTREGCDAVSEWSYGIVWVIVDYVLPYLKRVQELKEFADYSLHNRDELTRQINFWMDKHTQIEKENQQLKTQIAKLTEIVGVLPSNHSVGNLGYKIKNQRHEINNRLKEIDKLKELLKECKHIMNIEKDFASCHFEKHKLNELLTKIINAIGEKR